MTEGKTRKMVLRVWLQHLSKFFSPLEGSGRREVCECVCVSVFVCVRVCVCAHGHMQDLF